MGNLSTREKILIFCVVLLLVCAIFYIAALRPLNNLIGNAQGDLAEREAQMQYYEDLKASNNETKKQIEATEKTIKAQEASMLASVDGENIVNYVERVLEENGSPYQAKVSSQDIDCDDIILPNGDKATQSLILKRVSVEYATTDGFTVPEYDFNPTWIKDGYYDLELVADAVSKMGDETEYPIVGYKEFIESMKIIAKEIPSCVKIHNITIEDSKYGFCYLRAEIDVYGANLGSSKLTKDNDPAQVKLDWGGKTNVDCKGGMIGLPLVNFNQDSTFYLFGVIGDGVDTYVDRPYCSYFSNAIMVLICQENGRLYEDPYEKIPFTFEEDIDGDFGTGSQEGSNEGQQQAPEE